MGCGFVKEKNAHSCIKEKFDQLGMPIKRDIAEFKITEDAILPVLYLSYCKNNISSQVGTELTAAHFIPGQYVDVKGTTLGKGTQGRFLFPERFQSSILGVMKRWGFKGGPASHGTSKAHRKPGSIGNCQVLFFVFILHLIVFKDPGRVWKGKKMAGRMGGRTCLLLNAWVYKAIQMNDPFSI